ncbi:MAG: 2-C-methyl-D-erythritol 2,4-cyclodiphosphate synthase [Planctomycetota bacterium]
MPTPPANPSTALPTPLRIGHGYDLHRLEPVPPEGGGRPLVLAGIEIPHAKGLVAHSDGDVLFHAVTDAILGALAAPDIGQLFPDNDAANRGRASIDFLNEAVTRAAKAGYRIASLDSTVICERPKLAGFKAAIVESLVRALRAQPGTVNVKAKTNEGVDATGRGEAIEAHVVVLLVASIV